APARERDLRLPLESAPLVPRLTMVLGFRCPPAFGSPTVCSAPLESARARRLPVFRGAIRFPVGPSLTFKRAQFRHSAKKLLMIPNASRGTPDYITCALRSF